MAPIPTSGEMWTPFLMPSEVDIDFLLPNGIVLILNTACDVTLKNLKEAVWQEARLQPLFDLLGDVNSYIFVGLTQDAEEEEFFDETRRLCDLRLFHLVLRVVEPEGNKVENMLNSEISQCIGMSVSDLNKIHDEEIVTFRRSLLIIARDNMERLRSSGPEGVISYMYSEPVEPELLAAVKNKLKSTESLFIDAGVMTRSSCSSEANATEFIKFKIKLAKRSTVRETITEILRKYYTKRSRNLEDLKSVLKEVVDKYCLKVCCCRAYMMDLDQELIYFRYIQDCLTKKRTPLVQAVLKVELTAETPSVEFVQPTRALQGVGFQQEIANQAFVSMVDKCFSINVKCGQYVNSKDSSRLFVRVGIYHGNEALTTSCSTREMPNMNPNWNENMEFTLQLSDIPRAARVCLGLVQKAERNRNRSSISMGWANLNIFDQNGFLFRGKMTVPLWPSIDMGDNFLNPTGHAFHNRSSDAIQLVVEFPDYACPLSYPPEKMVLEYAEQAYHQSQPNHEIVNLGEIEEKISEITLRDPLCDISEQEKEYLWMYRNNCFNKPESLPQLVRSLKWSSRVDVACFYFLLSEWRPVNTEAALILLGSTIIDPFLRKFAVSCLDHNLSDTDLNQYLLQLVQSLKFEPYLDNELTRFLLQRALANPDIGLRLFWYLKAEMHQPAVRMRFGMILEAFCRGCGPLFKCLLRQSEALDKLCYVSEFVKKEKEEEQIRAFRDKLQQREILESIQDFISPLDRTNCLGELCIQQCAIMKSKKRPFWLTWSNPDPMAINHILDYKLIFKNGDDLRQDMLTLQLIRIMDKIWKEEGMDMKLVPYECLATGLDTGLIEAVRDAQTVMAIQNITKLAAAQLDNSQLHKWIQENNPGEQYDSAIKNFTRSCAGYCVATFVLGIRDRHPDNIMVNKVGQLFHIDFGHFLNNRKKKFGINRERVPFVLTADFICVIARGGDKRSSLFQSFMDLCGSAYLKLRHHSQLFLTLFSMMLSCGLPELSSLNDLEYIRKTLAVEMTEKDALDYFNAKFNEAYRNAWSTKVDWFSHALNR